jgi:hypothetical protein
MFAIPITRASPPVAVLLGGSGHARPAPRTPAVPALLRPRPTSPERSGGAFESRAAGG